MKLTHFFFAALLFCFPPLATQAQIGTSCLGCMPRTGPVYDSTMTTPSPPFTTSASTGDVYIPPREVIITVPGPAAPPPPVGNDPQSFSSTQFVCSAGGVGLDGARGAVLDIYKNSGGRCADTEGLTWWSTNLHNCVAVKRSWDFANSANSAEMSSFVAGCNIGLDNLGSDQPSMNALCSKDAGTRGFVTTAYNYVRGRDSDVCSKG